MSAADWLFLALAAATGMAVPMAALRVWVVWARRRAKLRPGDRLTEIDSLLMLPHPPGSAFELRGPLARHPEYPAQFGGSIAHLDLGDGAICPVLVTDAWALRSLGLRSGDRIALAGHFQTSVVPRPQGGYDRRPWFVCSARAVRALARDEGALS